MTFVPSPTLAAMRENCVDRFAERRMAGRRDYLYLEGWMQASGACLPLRNAEALAHVIEHMPVRLYPSDMLVGEHGNDHCMVNFRSRSGKDMTEAARAGELPLDMAERMETWLDAEPFRWMELAAPVVSWPEPLRQAQERGVVQVWGTDLNHSIRDYAKVLRLGFRGILAEVEAAIASVEPSDPHAPVRLANLQAFRRIAEACCGLGRRHAEALPTGSPLAEICARVPESPARSFREAVQALWFAHMITVWEDGVNANGIGRIDQFLWPYLERDLADGVITMQEAGDLLAALWLKLYQPYDVQQMMVGGQNPDGSDAVNPLSYLVLDVTEAMGFVRCLSARLHNGMPRDFVSRCVDLVARGGGIPFFFNDEALVPALADRGVAIEDARGYAAIGCIEITIPGKANPHAVSNWINLPKVLEIALHGGCDPRDGAQIGPRTNSLRECSTFDDVLESYTRQLEHFARWAAYGSNAAEIAHRSAYRLPYLSLLTDDCIARGLDIIEGGARYNYHSSAAMGVPNAADSLVGLKEAVFSSGRVSAEQMLEAMARNFTDDEGLRRFLWDRVPKYGNDSDEPDAMAAQLVSQYVAIMDRFPTPSGGRFFTHLFTFVLMLPMGKVVGATPDGRRAGEPLAYSVSPGQGRDRSGLTAVIRSLAAIPHDQVAASSSAILEADPTLLEGSGREAFVELLRTAVRLKVGQLQFNVVSAETLRAAQADPERYANLCVRVSGFSQRFNLLDREMQDHIIARTKHRTA
jgi:formate C-acetyltransferase